MDNLGLFDLLGWKARFSGLGFYRGFDYKVFHAIIYTVDGLTPLVGRSLPSDRALAG
jgi:hypothetical protein